METSRYFERTLFYDRSPAADEYYQQSGDLIFEKDVSKARIEVRYQPSSFARQKSAFDQAKPWKSRLEPLPSPASGKSDEFVPVGDSHSYPEQLLTDGDDTKSQFTAKQQTDLSLDLDQASDSDDNRSLSSRASSTALPLALDQRQGAAVPPTYPGLPKLTVVEMDLDNIEGFVQQTKNDFRVFYLRQRHSQSRIQITKELFESLLMYCNVFPRFNEYLIGFGNKKNETEVGPPPLKFRSLSTSHSNEYRGFECSYILRYIEFTNRSGGRKPWSLRQFAIYHRYKPSQPSRCSTWILVGASQRTELRLDRYTRSIKDLVGANPFELHVIFLDTVIASWRPYLIYLTQLVKFQSDKADGITIGESEDSLMTIEVEDHQHLKQIEDDISDLLLCLESILDTLSTFKEMYDQFRMHHNGTSSKGNSTSEITHETDAVVFALKEQTKEVSYTRKKAEALLSKVRNTRTLISSLLERQSGHNIDQQIAALNMLERQGQDENIIMRQLAEKSSRDSSSMRILTIITMIYLPCTIVSNFYSTQFVTSKELDTGINTLEYTTNAWLFFAIAIPLTLFTILIWYFWVNWERIIGWFSRRSQEPRSGRINSSQLFARKDSLIGLPR